MRTVRLGRTGIEVSAVSFGTWPHSGPVTMGERSVGWSGHDDALAREALAEAFRQGITHWDTADVYGNGHAEELIGGLWSRVPRDQVFLASKVGWDPGPHDHFYHPDQIHRQVERSLRLLCTDHLDLYYLHHCDFGANDVHLEGAVSILRKLREQGVIRFLGLSDWDSSKIMRVIDRVDPDVVQPYRNVIDDTYASSGLRAWIERHDVGVAFFSPIRHGLLLGKYSKPATFPEGDHRRHVDGFSRPETIAHLARCREQMRAHFPAHPEAPLEGLVGALLEDAPTGCVLLGMRNPDQVRAASHAGMALNHEEAEWVRALYREPAR